MAEVTSVIIKDYSPEVLRAMESQVQTALKAIGAEAEGYAKKDCPVDTGRLRNSISWATNTGNTGGGKGADGTPKTTPEDNAVYIGSNVDYAPTIEYKDMSHKVGKAHFIRDALATHGDRYKAILEAFLKF